MAINWDDTYDQPTSAPNAPDPTPARQRIRQAYLDYLGREGGQAEWDSHLDLSRGSWQNPSYLQGRVNYIQNSPEALAWAARGAGGGGGGGGGGTGGGPSGGGGRTYSGNDPLAWLQSQFGGLAPTTDSLTELYNALTAGGVNVSRPTRAGGALSDDKLSINNTMYDFIRDVGGPGAAWQVLVDDGSAGSPGGPGAAPPVNPYEGGQFTDPATKHLEALLAQQTAFYQQQRQLQEQQNTRSQQRWNQANASSEDLLNYLRQRSATLQQPAYTGAEAEVLRTRALEPIENDRQAARQRALGRVSQSGMDLSSGIAQQLLNDVDAGFDRSRAGAQNDLAYRQITEERSRQQEAQALLALIPEIQRAGAAGDVEFLQQLHAAVNAPQLGAIATGQQLYELPTNAMQAAMAAMGMAPSPESLMSGTLQLAQLNQMGRQQGLGWWEQMGAMLPYLMQGFSGGGGGMLSAQQTVPNFNLGIGR